MFIRRNKMKLYLTSDKSIHKTLVLKLGNQYSVIGIKHCIKTPRLIRRQYNQILWWLSLWYYRHVCPRGTYCGTRGKPADHNTVQLYNPVVSTALWSVRLSRKVAFHWAVRRWLTMLALTSGFSVSSAICLSSSLRLYSSAKTCFLLGEEFQISLSFSAVLVLFTFCISIGKFAFVLTL